jgi:hypothetical protein
VLEADRSGELGARRAFTPCWRPASTDGRGQAVLQTGAVLGRRSRSPTSMRSRLRRGTCARWSTGRWVRGCPGPNRATIRSDVQACAGAGRGLRQPAQQRKRRRTPCSLISNKTARRPTAERPCWPPCGRGEGLGQGLPTLSDRCRGIRGSANHGRFLYDKGAEGADRCRPMPRTRSPSMRAATVRCWRWARSTGWSPS